MRKNTKRIIAALAFVTFFSLVSEPAFSVQISLTEQLQAPIVYAQVVRVKELKSESVVKVTELARTSPCIESSVQTNFIQGSVVDLNVPASCYALTRSEVQIYTASLQVVSKNSVGVIKVVSVPAKIKSPSFEKAGSKDLPLLPVNNFDLLFSVVSLAVLSKVIFGELRKTQSNLGLQASFNRFSILRC